VRLGSLLHLYRIRLRSRLVAELLAGSGIAVGVALVFAALVASSSLTGSVRQLSEGITGAADAQLAARGPDGFPERMLRRVSSIEGVRWAAPVVEARVNLVSPGGLRSLLLVGADPRFGRFGGELLRHLPASGPDRGAGLLLPAPLAAALGVETGDRVRLEKGASSRPVRVAGILHESEVGSLVRSPVALASLPLAQRIAGMPGRVSRIFVSSDAGRGDAVHAALTRIAADRLDVQAADHEVAVLSHAAYPTNASTALFSVLSAAVGFLFALSAMLLTVPQRRRLIDELRLAGYQPWVIVELLLFDALALGAIGSALGLVLGDQVSRHLFAGVPSYLASAFPIGSQRIVTWQSVAVAGAAGVGAACLAVLAPLRETLSRNPVRPEAVATGSIQAAWWTPGGLALLAVTAAIPALAPRATLAGIGTLMLALLCLLPALLRFATLVFDRACARMRSPVAILATLELRSGAARIRTLAVAATGAVAVFATVAIGGAHADLQRGVDNVVFNFNRGGDVWITFGGQSNTFDSAPFALSPRQWTALERLPGVRGVRRHGGGLLDVGDYRVWVQAPPRSLAGILPASQLRDGDLHAADARLRGGGWMVLSEAVASQLGVGIGDRVVLPTPAPLPFRVAAISTNLGWPGGAMVVNASDFARAWRTRSVDAIAVELEPGEPAKRVARAVRGVLGRQSPLRVETRTARIRRQRAASREGLARLSQISAMVVVAAIFAMAVAIGGMIWQRRPTLAALKVHGFDRRELWRSLLLESGLLLGAGCLVGAAFGLLGQMLLDRALEKITGFPVVYIAAGPLAAVMLVLITGVAVAVLAIPGWLAVRVRPVVGPAA
jgi:putative ABC transport system permease protein